MVDKYPIMGEFFKSQESRPQEYWDNFFKEYWNRPTFEEYSKIRKSPRLRKMNEKEAITEIRGGEYYQVK